jgi:hypothetical protein
MAYEEFENTKGSDLDARTGESGLAINEYGGGGISESPLIRIENDGSLSLQSETMLFEWAQRRGLKKVGIDHLAFEFLFSREKKTRTFESGGDWPDEIVGSASVGRNPGSMQVTTGTTSGSYGKLQSGSGIGVSLGQNRDVINWGNPVCMYVRFATAAQTTNGHARVTLGKTGADDEGALVRKGIGIEIENTTLYGIVHNGTSQTRVSLGTVTTLDTYTVDIIGDGAGNFSFYLNGDLDSVETTSAGPSGLGTGGESNMQIEAENGADSASQNITVFDLKLWSY